MLTGFAGLSVRTKAQNPVNTRTFRTLSAPYLHPESLLAGSSNTVNLTKCTGFGLLSLMEIPAQLKIHPETW